MTRFVCRLCAAEFWPWTPPGVPASLADVIARARLREHERHDHGLTDQEG